MTLADLAVEPVAWAGVGRERQPQDRYEALAPLDLGRDLRQRLGQDPRLVTGPAHPTGGGDQRRRDPALRRRRLSWLLAPRR